MMLKFVDVIIGLWLKIGGKVVAPKVGKETKKFFDLF